MSGHADRIRRILSDGAPKPAEPRRSDPPLLRQVDERTRMRLEQLGVTRIGPPPPTRTPAHPPGDPGEIASAPATHRKPPASSQPPSTESPSQAADDVIAQATGARLRSTEAGEFLFLERHVPLDQTHGEVRLVDALAHPIPLRPAERRGLAAPAPSHVRADEVVFLDTETTGLAGGTGTVAFLVGTGRVEGEVFVLRQYFLRDYPDEPGLLHALTEDIEQLPLVTFNGRSFDWPLLTTRWRMHRHRPTVRAHADLLPTARRLWARTLHSHSLAALERHVLGLDRGEDIPGWQIPRAWFDFLRGGPAHQVIAAFRHNEIDVVSMLALFARVGHTLELPLERVAKPGDQLGTARLFLDLDQPALARRCLEAGLAASTEEEAHPLHRLLGRLYRQAGQHDTALGHWAAVARSAPGFDLEAYEQVAKIHEHARRDYTEALAWTEEALRLAEPASRAARLLDHRAGRLRAKQARQARVPVPAPPTSDGACA